MNNCIFMKSQELIIRIPNYYITKTPSESIWWFLYSVVGLFAKNILGKEKKMRYWLTCFLLFYV